MQLYNVDIRGSSPLLMHHDNIEWADIMSEVRATPEHKKTGKAGDDRYPSYTWLGACYQDGQQLCIPAANIMRSIMEGGAMVPVPGAKHGKTFKSQTQSGIRCVDPSWPLHTAQGALVPWDQLEDLQAISSFTQHKRVVASLGFQLLVKRAKVGTSKHVRVRPYFDIGWRIAGNLLVIDEQITQSALDEILRYAGRYKGLGDWRPGGKTPGPYGMFEATVTAVAG